MNKVNKHSRNQAIIKWGLMLFLVLALSLISGCFDPTNPDDKLVAAINHGKNFFENNCSICHAAGNQDTTTAFDASDLAQTDLRLIQTDLSLYSGPLLIMGQFADLDPVTVEDLKAYFSSL